MKGCPYCGGTIQDAAVKCRWCGRMLVPPTPPTEAGPTFTHSGVRYVLGYGHDLIGIWDREAPAEPAERYPRSADGWVVAWRRFAALEPGAEAVAPAYRAHAAPGARQPGPSVTAAAVMLIVIGALYAISGAVFLAVPEATGDIGATSGEVRAGGTFVLAFGILEIVAGIMVVRRARAGRTLGIVLASIAAVFALGTVGGGGVMAGLVLGAGSVFVIVALARAGAAFPVRGGPAPPP
ncbi:MAG TPA: hypothetical protein VEO00_03990 [Actinomycetota bacterium]|nr:hypothetical protein [Actinomycetota bacterium]